LTITVCYTAKLTLTFHSKPLISYPDFYSYRFCQFITLIATMGVMPQVVLVHPLIPPNTGNIARTCAATGTPLHLVGPLGFEISDRYLKRAGLDYWPYVDLHYHESLTEFQSHCQAQGGRWIGFSTSGMYSYVKFQFHSNDWLLFGSETSGLPRDLLQTCDATVHIPMHQPQVRSLNLSVSVAIGLFEARRQLGYFA
jgi:tRNA (cytidine/uridine-2'-O-)-methyltransferase